MDIEKVVEFVPKYLSEYTYAFTETLRHPSAIYAPVPAGAAPPVTGATDAATKLNPQLFTFAILSAVLGLVLRQVLPSPDQLPVHVMALTVLILWFTASALLHGLLRLFGGQGGFLETITVAMHVLAAIYVVCNLVGLIARVIGRTPMGDINDIEVVEAIAYFPLQFLLLSIYIPFAVRPLHRVTRWRLFLAVVLWCGAFAIAGIILFFVVGQPMASHAAL